MRRRLVPASRKARLLLTSGLVALTMTPLAVVTSAAPASADITVKTRGGETCGVIPYDIDLVIVVGAC
jgi:hypothetical protein